MLSREKRLVRGRDFDRVYQKGKRVHAKHFNLSFAPNNIALTRIGIVVGKKFSKKATERNRIKRVFREVAKENYGIFPRGFDFVIFVKKTDGAEPRHDILRKEMLEALSKTGLKK